MSIPDVLNFSSLRQGYAEGAFTPRELVAHLAAKADSDDPAIWIHRLSPKELEPYLDALEGAPHLPLYGVPFVIKDNIDLAGIPTTAGCPEFAYTPELSAGVVRRLIRAGAIPMGKTNLDQFAAGLVGTRSPYGVPVNPFDPAYIPGGSSSGSAVAVAKGLAAFALGTDTAGSGRVPAAFNNLVGLKPTKGRLPTTGVVPACRSLDCVSVFSLNCADAETVMQVSSGYDPGDPYARRAGRHDRGVPLGDHFRFGVPREDQLKFFANDAYRELFAEALRQLEAVGGIRVELDCAPFFEAAQLLYEGPWVAERYSAVGAFIASNPDAVLPVTRAIIEGGRLASAVDAFEAQYRLQDLAQRAADVSSQVHAIVMPTTGTHYTRAEIEADPVALNSRLGHYTNFMNLLDRSAVAVPAGFSSAGLPFGITLFGDPMADELLLRIASLFHAASGCRMGTTSTAVPQAAAQPPAPGYRIVVCGAHMRGLPLNHQLTSLGGRFVHEARTAPVYRMFALIDPPPARPGLVRDEKHGQSIEVEVWELPLDSFGHFVFGIPAPLGIGTIRMEDGSALKGFLCEASETAFAEEISGLGGWRAWLAAERS